MIITLCGIAGSGKTTVGRLLAKRLGYKFYSMGDLRGKMAMERGLTIDQLNEIGKNEAWTDNDVDDYAKELGKKEDKLVVDGWVAWHFIPHSFKVLLTVDPETAAERVFKEQRPDEEKKATIPAMKRMLLKRLENNRERYHKHYGIVDFMDRKHFDFVVDTTDITAQQVADKIFEALKSK